MRAAGREANRMVRKAINASGDGRRDSTDNRYPFLVGLGFGLALGASPWMPQPKIALLPVLGLVLAVPIATLRVRNRRLAWIGPWHTTAAVLAVLTTVGLMIIPVVVMAGTPNPFDLPNLIAFPPGLVVLVLEGLFAAWIASQFQRWAVTAEGVVPAKVSRWDPRGWGALGVVGGTLSLMTAPSLFAIAALYSGLPSLGPSRMGYFFGGAIAAIAVIVGLAFILAEVKGTR